MQITITAMPNMAAPNIVASCCQGNKNGLKFPKVNAEIGKALIVLREKAL